MSFWDKGCRAESLPVERAFLHAFANFDPLIDYRHADVVLAHDMPDLEQSGHFKIVSEMVLDKFAKQQCTRVTFVLIVPVQIKPRSLRRRRCSPCPAWRSRRGEKRERQGGGKSAPVPDYSRPGLFLSLRLFEKPPLLQALQAEIDASEQDTDRNQLRLFDL